MGKRQTALNPARPLDPEFAMETRIASLQGIYMRSANRLTRTLAKAGISDFKRFRTEELLRQVNREIVLLNDQAKGWVGKALPEAYVHGIRVAKESVRAHGLSTADINFGNRIHTNAVKVLSDQVVLDLLVANGSIKKNFHRYIRATQQHLIEDLAISKTLAEGIVEGVSRKTSSDALYKQLSEQMGAQHFITINGRNYDPAKYAVLVARTRTREASSQGTVNSAVQLGMDLVQIDVHGDACPICQTRMGRVYSLTGENPPGVEGPTFPILDAKPPFHPNCRCNVFPVTRTVLIARGEMDTVKKLSNDTPKFLNAKKAEAWLKDNEDKRLTTLGDYRNFLATGDRRGAKPHGVTAVVKPKKVVAPKKPKKPKASLAKSAVKKSTPAAVAAASLQAQKSSDAYQKAFETSEAIKPKKRLRQTKELKDFWDRVPQTRKMGNIDDVSARLSTKTGLDKFDIKQAMQSWAEDSNTNATSAGIQQATERVFGIKRSTWQVKRHGELTKRKAVGAFGKKRSDYDRLVKAMYDDTQEEFAKAGITHVTVHRGIRDRDKVKRIIDAGGYVDTVLGAERAAATSFSSSFGIGKKFARRGIGRISPENSGMVLTAEVPVSRILSTSFSGIGTRYENEMVLIGPKKDDEFVVSFTDRTRRD